jgi:CRISPR-associated protein Cas5d
MNLTQNQVAVKVSGDWACFTRPEFKVERVSYPVITPSAARGLLEAILWKPQFRYQITEIVVLNPIVFGPIRRNEVKSKIPARNAKSWMNGKLEPEPFYADEDRTQRNTLALRDVDYVIKAEIVLTDLANKPRKTQEDLDEEKGPDSVVKYREMFNRRVAKGQCFHQPCLGCREFPAAYEPWAGNEEPIKETKDLGLMLYDVFDLNAVPKRMEDEKDLEATRKIRFFRAVLKDGVVKVPAWDEVFSAEVKR